MWAIPIFLLLILLSGRSEAQVGVCNDQGECLITKEAAKLCKANTQKAQKFDRLAAECKKVKAQKVDIQALLNVRTGERNEARRQEEANGLEADEAKAKLAILQAEADSRWSPITWALIGAGATILGGGAIFIATR